MKLVRYSSDAAKALRRHGNAARIRKAFTDYAANPAAHANNVTSLVGSDLKRMRIGDFRAIFEESATELFVTRIGPRGSIYKD